jgi:hypothetical protein
MQRAISLGIIIIAALAVVGVAAYFFTPRSEPVSSGPMGKLSVETDTSIRNMVKEFGGHLKNVSLLSTSTVGAQLESEYGTYLSASLLTQWKANPFLAIGRNVSSPWPERIEVVSVSPVGNNTYTVEANVIELTSADKPMEPAAVYPVTLTVVEESTGVWKITAVSKGAYSEIPQRTTIVGVWECLPHKGDGPHTLECAFGLKEDGTGKHYAVSTELMSTYPVDYPTGAHVRVAGIMVPKNQLNSDAWDTYDIVGIIGATTIEKL